ncbi:hypothetical protein SOCE26_046910 [Sorangium cellulosum]|uniref:DUF4398 domain-containing protein n=1 Tax=Sorangium cellulosum TaxID=56 RepID=A0A2L0EVC6_SORCE|nr:DUF4398 domain-containing protein [Sorangium cellulosum]AUX43247.1 hypothetical protein SOCE26_046910 [Sorangium cellulosum]
MRSHRWILAILLLGGLAGCASAPPPAELLHARKSYERARKSAAAELAPVDLHGAREALERAERAFTGDLGSAEARDLAYIAERRAQLAESLGSTAAAERLRGAALQVYGEVHIALRRQADAAPGPRRQPDEPAPQRPAAPRGRERKAPARGGIAVHPPAILDRR